MAMILKDLTIGEFVGSIETSLYNTGTVAVTNGGTSALKILPGQPIDADGIATTAPLGIAFEGVELDAGESYNVAAITNGFGCVLNLSKLTERFATNYTAAMQTALEAMGFVFKS